MDAPICVKFFHLLLCAATQSDSSILRPPLSLFSLLFMRLYRYDDLSAQTRHSQHILLKGERKQILLLHPGLGPYGILGNPPPEVLRL